MLKRLVLAITCLLTPAILLAQAPTSSAQAVAPGAVAKSDDIGIAEIVVTAERRAERLQDVPLAVSVINSDNAAKLGNIDTNTLPTQIPALQTSRQLSGQTIYLRGVGTISGPGNENAVATYVDDVYINGYSSSIVSFNNIDRVEVLKGPQGTLFGRNATGGVIHIVTKDPSETPRLDAQLGYANYRTFSSNLYGTTGIGHDMAVDIAYFSREQKSGWGHDLSTGKDINLGKEYGVRSKLKWSPDEATFVVLEADHYWNDYDYGLEPGVQNGSYSAGLGTFVGNYNNQLIDPYSSSGKSGNDSHVDGETLTIEHKFSGATLRNILAARRAEGFALVDLDLGPAYVQAGRINTQLEQYTEELHLSSTEGNQLGGHDFHWQGGVFLMKMNDALNPVGIQGSVLGGLAEYRGYNKSYVHSYAGFLDGTLALGYATDLTLGARYTEDRIRNRSYSEFVTADNGTSSTPPFFQEVNAGKPTYRIILDHKITEDFMAYVSVSSGFKSGGYSLFSGGTPPTLPEELNAYAVGLKTEWFNHRFQLNAEAYDYKYTHQQVSVTVGNGAFDINAAGSKIYGFDLNAIVTPLTDLTLTANYGYLHGRYQNFPGALVYLQQPATCDPSPMRLPGPIIPGNLLCGFNAAGKPTIRSPTHSGNISIDYVMLRGEHGSVDWAANYYRTSSFNWDPDGQFPEPTYGLFNTAVTWKSPDAKYDLQLWCTNCGNTYHDTYIAESGAGMQRAPEAPREFGVKFGAHFR